MKGIRINYLFLFIILLSAVQTKKIIIKKRRSVRAIRVEDEAGAHYIKAHFSWLGLKQIN